MKCSALPPSNELCLVEIFEDIEQCPHCLRVFCYHCIQQHSCDVGLVVEAPKEVWVAYYLDWQGCGIFATEIEALRHALEYTMRVMKVRLPAKDVKTEGQSRA